MSQTFTLSPEYSYEVSENYKTQQTDFQLGYVSTRAYWPIPKRKFVLQWTGATQVEKEYITSFFRDIGGPAGSFLYVPADPIATPHRGGDPSQVSGGALALRTYNWVITFVTASGETMPSPDQAYQVSASYLFTITVPKFWYRSITKCRVYVGSFAAYNLQAEITQSGGVWQQVSIGLVGGASPPTVNTALESLTVHLMEDSLVLTKTTAVSYNISMQFEEVF